MAINKVIANNKVLIDLTGDSVTPETLAEGATAHDKTGALIVGTMKSGSGSGGGGGGSTGDSDEQYVTINIVIPPPLTGAISYENFIAISSIEFTDGFSETIEGIVVGSELIVFFDQQPMAAYCEGDSMAQYELNWNPERTAFILIVPNENATLGVVY